MEVDYTGGCEGMYLQKGVMALVAILAILFVYYVYTFLSDAKLIAEPMCGGGDQMCACAGNETMTAGRVINTRVKERIVNDNYLTKTMTGR